MVDFAIGLSGSKALRFFKAGSSESRTSVQSSPRFSRSGHSVQASHDPRGPVPTRMCATARARAGSPSPLPPLPPSPNHPTPPLIPPHPQHLHLRFGPPLRKRGAPPPQQHGAHQELVLVDQPVSRELRDNRAAPEDHQ